jgi:hypothetical protein
MTYVIPPERRDGFLYVNVSGDEYLLHRNELTKALTFWNTKHQVPVEFKGLFDESIYIIPRDILALVDMPAHAIVNKAEAHDDYRKECAIEGIDDQ